MHLRHTQTVTEPKSQDKSSRWSVCTKLCLASLCVCSIPLMARSTADWYPLFTAVSLNRLFQILLFHNVLFRQIIIQLSCRDFLIHHLSCNVLCCWQVQMVFPTKAAICVAVLNRNYCFTHSVQSVLSIPFGHFRIDQDLGRVSNFWTH